VHDASTPVTAFDGEHRLARGPLAEVARVIAALAEPARVLIFRDDDGRSLDLDLRGTPDEVVGRLVAPAEAPPRGPGRPKLGVPAREVTLLPRHWERLARQPGGPPVALRKRGGAELLLGFAGDAASNDVLAWMRAEIARRGIEQHVLLTGWLPQHLALGYAVRAEVGLSPIPRGTLFDVSSPTKLVEYLALGIPSVANDIPDQQLVIDESGAGLCVPMEAAPFARAVRRLLDDRALAAAFAQRGPVYVKSHRTYAILGQIVAETYTKILPR